MEEVINQLRQAVTSVDALYHRLVLLTGESGSGKTKALRAVANDLGTEVINVNLELSAELLELTAKQRALRLSEILGNIVARAPSPVLLDNLEILFDKELQQDPLRLLQGLSRNHTVVASWNKTSVDGKLLYAASGHPEYRCYESVDAVIVSMDSTAVLEEKNNNREAGPA